MQNRLPKKRTRAEFEALDLDTFYWPDDILIKIADFLPDADMIRATRVNQQFRSGFLNAAKMRPPLLDYTASPTSTQFKPSVGSYYWYTCILKNGYVITYENAMLQIWDGIAGTCLFKINLKGPKDHYVSMKKIIGLPNNTFISLVEYSHRKQFTLWDSKTGRCLKHFTLPEGIDIKDTYCILPLSSHKIMVVEHTQIYTLDLTAGKLKYLVPNFDNLKLKDCILLANGELLCAFSENNFAIRRKPLDLNLTLEQISARTKPSEECKSHLKIYDTQTGKCRLTLVRNLEVCRLALLVNGQFATLSEIMLKYTEPVGVIDIWDSQTGVWLRTLTTTADIRHPLFETLPDGHLLLNNQSQLYVINPLTGMSINKLAEGNRVTVLADGRIMAITYEGNIYLWSFPQRQTTASQCLPPPEAIPSQPDKSPYDEQDLIDFLMQLTPDNQQAWQIFKDIKRCLLLEEVKPLQSLMSQLGYFKLSPQEVRNAWGSEFNICLQKAYEIAQRGHYWQGKVRLSLMLYNVILWLEPHHLAARLARACYFNDNQEEKLALIDIGYLLHHFPEKHEGYYLLMHVLLQKDSQNSLAKMLLEKFKKYTYVTPKYLVLRAEVYLQLGNYQEALADIEKGLHLNSSPADTYALLSRKIALLKHLKQFRNAITLIDKLSALSGGYLQEVNLRIKGDCLMALRETTKAEECYQKAWDVFAVDRRNHLYERYAEQNYLVKVLDLLGPAHDINGLNMLEVAKAYYDTHAYEKALWRFIRIENIYKDAPIYPYLKECAAQIKQTSMALHAVISWLICQPNDFWKHVEHWLPILAAADSKAIGPALARLLPHELLRLLPAFEILWNSWEEQCNSKDEITSAKMKEWIARNILYSHYLSPPTLIAADTCHYNHSYGLRRLPSNVSSRLRQGLQQQGLFSSHTKPSTQEAPPPLSEEEYTQLITQVPEYF